jgi:hypothetical protein
MLVGVVLVGLGVKSFMDTRHFLAAAQPATGEVVRVDTRIITETIGTTKNRTTRDVLHYFPLVEFRTARGQVARFQFDNGSSLDNGREGESVRLLYDPANPSHARPDTGKSPWSEGFAPTVTGLGFLVGFGGVYLLLRRWARGGSRRGRRTSGVGA